MPLITPATLSDTVHLAAQALGQLLHVDVMKRSSVS